MSRTSRSDRIRVKDFGATGLRIAYRDGTVDERAVDPWLRWAHSTEPIPQSRSDEAILDIGAHIGGFALLAAWLAPERRVLAVEASRESYELLVRNVELNGLNNVEPAHLALGGQAGLTRLHHDSDGNWGHTIAKPFDEEGAYEEVACETLVGFLERKGVDRCALVKLNCEGGEFPILIEAPLATLRAIRQMQILCHSRLVDGDYTMAELEARLRDAGFKQEHHGTRNGGGRIFAHRN